MQSSAAARLAYSLDSGAEGSFPERHLDDDVAPSSGIGPEGYKPAVTASHMFEPSVTPLPSHAWPGQNQPFLPYSHHHIPAHNQLVGTTAISGPEQQTIAPLRPEWTSLREQNPRGARWLAAQSEFAVDDDSSSVTSPDGGPDEFCPPLPTQSSQNPRRLSTHRIARPTEAPAPIPNFQPTARSGRPYIPDFDYNMEWPDPSDAGGFFIPQPNYENAAGKGPEIEVTYRGSPSSSSKVDSKRIAHKLSEKSRRNRLTIAIREIQKLLPSEVGGEDDGEAPSQQDADYTVRPGVPSSKLDIVEMAVGFIKDLKEKNAVMKRRLRELEKEMERCQCRHGPQDAVMAESESMSKPSSTEDTAG
ncbi:hypothetical protein N657DRAFT_568924 [Parathielavia appendiculata]|uniref:BHLH domain-containing protein n=1 Tax=Parathielavia appendiculata TaxID=2587402 RepID=A0AAN6U4V7_9PEZI|nr:hypothetical protein N657DRAFT_568924 [Parathielavia appendiculata]